MQAHRVLGMKEVGRILRSRKLVSDASEEEPPIDMKPVDQVEEHIQPRTQVLDSVDWVSAPSTRGSTKQSFRPLQVLLAMTRVRNDAGNNS